MQMPIGLLRSDACGMIERHNGKKPPPEWRPTGRFRMKHLLARVVASLLALGATAAMAQSKPPLKLGGILDMSSLYADITGAGAETAARMAAGELGGEGLGR